MDEGLPPNLIQLWTVRITTWENDWRTPEVPETEVRQHLVLEEEQEQVQLGSEGPDHCTCVKFLLFGLDFEHRQYVSLFFVELHYLYLERRKQCALIVQCDPAKLPTDIIKQHTAFRRQLMKFHKL